MGRHHFNFWFSANKRSKVLYFSRTNLFLGVDGLPLHEFLYAYSLIWYITGADDRLQMLIITERERGHEKEPHELIVSSGDWWGAYQKAVTLADKVYIVSSWRGNTPQQILWSFLPYACFQDPSIKWRTITPSRYASGHHISRKTSFKCLE